MLVPFDDSAWTWDGSAPEPTAYRGRSCVRLESTTGTLRDVSFLDGSVELELAVSAERGFPGVMWRAQDAENFEAFFVRPHQVGNDDAIQYTPVFNGSFGWQLYHGDGYWAPVAFPLDDWFTIRVVFARERAEIFVADLDRPALTIHSLRRRPERGAVGVFVGAPTPPVHVARFAYEDGSVAFRAPTPRAEAEVDGIVPVWSVSDTFAEGEEPDLESRTWTDLPSEPSGLANLARVNALRDGRNTAYARVTICSRRAQTVRLELGFSDRALVRLNGRPLYRGDDSYRSRDYRFLGSIGWFDTVYLPLDEGDNDLVVAVSEDFGGWGVQARLPDQDAQASTVFRTAASTPSGSA